MVENAIFHCLVEERKQERKKIGAKVFPSRPTFFILPNLEENQEGKVMRNAFYTNTLTLLHSPTPLTFPLLYNKDIIVSLYKLHFPSFPFSLQPNKKVFHHFTIPFLQPNTHEGKPNLFYSSTNFSSSHFSTPPTKRTQRQWRSYIKAEGDLHPPPSPHNVFKKIRIYAFIHMRSKIYENQSPNISSQPPILPLNLSYFLTFY